METYLRTKLDICGYNGHFDDSDNTHKANYAQETKNVVIAALVLPQTPENEKKLDEDDRKWDETCKKDAINSFAVPQWLGNLTRGVVRLRRVFVC